MVLGQKWSRMEVGRKDDSELNVGKKDVAREKTSHEPTGKIKWTELSIFSEFYTFVKHVFHLDKH